MGGSIEDKLVYDAVGLLRGGPRFYALDSTDPQKLKSIIDDMQERSAPAHARLAALHPGRRHGPGHDVLSNPSSTWRSWPVLLREDRHRFHPEPALPDPAGLLLDQFAEPRGITRVPLQLDGRNTTAGRHSAPLTRGSLYPLALAGVDLTEWIAAAQLSPRRHPDRLEALRFPPRAGARGPRQGHAAAAPHLGRRRALDQAGLRGKPRQKRRARHQNRDRRGKTRVYQQARIRGRTAASSPSSCEASPTPRRECITALRHAKLSARDPDASPAMRRSRKYMQFIHYVVFGLGLSAQHELRHPARRRTLQSHRCDSSPIPADGWPSRSLPNQEPMRPQSPLRGRSQTPRPSAPGPRIRRAHLLRRHALRRRRPCYPPHSRNAPPTACSACRLKMPVDVYEGPAMNHSYHEMIIGHGHCFTIVIASARSRRVFRCAALRARLPHGPIPRHQDRRSSAARPRRRRAPGQRPGTRVSEALQRFFDEVAAQLFKTDSSENG